MVRTEQAQPDKQGKSYVQRDREDIIRHAKESLPSAYLTLISIIQGVVFGYLVAVFYSERDKFDAIAWCNTYTSLVIIMIIWTVYMLSSFLYIHLPNLVDTVIAFGYAVLEITLISFLRNFTLWLLVCICFLFFSILVRVYESIQVHKNFVDNEYILDVFKRRKVIPITFVISVLYTLLVVIVFLLYERLKSIGYASIILALIPALLASLYFVLLAFYFRVLLEG